ncbi:MAG: pantoate--beta-alanine ligase, partial [Pseudomonadota bacterium]
QMVRDLHLPVDIVGAPIVREDDGLAMSSRNQYLSAEERAIAGQLNQVMRQSLAALQKGTDIKTVLQTGKEALKKAGLTNIDYFELRSVPDLRPLTTGKLPPEAAETARLFAAVMLGKTRLIDNMACL